MSEIMKKVPQGYRELTGDEKEDFLSVGTGITLIEFSIRQHQAELESAKLRTELAQSKIREMQREMQIALKQRDEQNAKLKIGYGKDEVIVDGKSVYVIERPEDWKPPEKTAPGKPDFKVLPGTGSIEVTKTPGEAPPSPPAGEKKG